MSEERLRIVGNQALELRGEADRLLGEITATFSEDEATAEERNAARKKMQRVTAIKEEIDELVAVREAAKAIGVVEQREVHKPGADKGAEKFGSLGNYLTSVFLAEFRGKRHPKLRDWKDPEEPNVDESKVGWVENQKDLLESVGASGGYLVPTEQGTTLLTYPDGTDTTIRDGATVIRLRRRAMSMPTLDQTGTTAGRPHWWGGLLARWTEEAAEKDETEPSFRQLTLVAHKLVVYTEASDELLADSAVALEDFLSAAFGEAIQWYQEEAFLNGTGAGQPHGIIPAPATITVPPAAIGAIAVGDFTDMLQSFMGRSPIWIMSRRWMSDLLQLNGPAGNPSYVFIPNARDGAPATLFGYPVHYSEHSPLPGDVGSIALVDRSKYLIGDRQAVTVDASKHFRFQNDLTAWRAVARVDGQPWLSAPLTYSDGTTEVSPFVILGIHPAS